jgi:putative endopeptidase
MKQFFALSIACTLLYSCTTGDKTETKEPAKADFLASNLDTTVKAGDDFFDYANGGWIKKNPIPGDLSSYGIGQLVNEENLKRLRELSEAAAKANDKAGTNSQKIGDFWSTAMDSANIEERGLKPLQASLDKISAIKDISSLLSTTAELKKLGSSTLFSDGPTQDAKNSDVMVFQFWQGGLGLPERAYYFKMDSATTEIRNKYVAYITTILTMSGEDSVAAGAEAKNILALETKMAQASRKIEDLRDPYRNYNKMAVHDMAKMSTAIDWPAYLTATGAKSLDSVVVGQPEFFANLGNLLQSTPLPVWKSYIKFNLVSDFSAALPDRFGIASFKFSQFLSGAKERRPRWKRVIQMENQLLGEPLGQLYVKEFFSEKAKQRYSDEVEAIRTALKERIAKLTWMSDSTKQKAYAKLASMKKKVGYPDKWKDFSAMEIGKESFVQNLINANTWWYNYNMNKLGKPVDRDEWDMTPQTYNAYYNPSNNEIVLPAAQFIVPGYKDEELDDALVYGYAAASTIGHEITHGFDDEGRQFDEKGNLANWWSKKDEEEFNKRAEVMVQQFNSYEPLPGYHINGKASLGENIADLGGILLGVDAFKKTAQYKEGKTIAGLTPMQRFFLGYSLGWLFQQQEKQLRSRLLTDVHSPAKYRVNGPFVSVDEFYSSFNIKPGDKMYLADSLRVHIW